MSTSSHRASDLHDRSPDYVRIAVLIRGTRYGRIDRLVYEVYTETEDEIETVEEPTSSRRVSVEFRARSVHPPRVALDIWKMFG